MQPSSYCVEATEALSGVQTVVCVGALGDVIGAWVEVRRAVGLRGRRTPQTGVSGLTPRGGMVGKPCFPAPGWGSRKLHLLRAGLRGARRG